MVDEIGRRAQDKFTAAIHRRNRVPLAFQIEQEHFADLGLIRKQAETAFKQKREYFK